MVETDRFPTEGFTLTEVVEETGSSLFAKAYHLGLGRQCLIKASCLEREKDCLKSEAVLLTECKNEALLSSLIKEAEEVGIFLRSS